MFEKLSHVGIAVRDLDRALETYRLLCPTLTVGERIVVSDQGVEVCFLSLANNSVVTRIELLAPLDSSGPVARFLDKRGEGLHHLCFSCQNLEERIARLRSEGMVFIDNKPRAGADGARIAFIHPSSTAGTLIELEEELAD